MKIAYLIDRDSLGGGMEYIRRQIALHDKDECQIFESVKGECTAKKINGFGADAIIVNHLKALLQLYQNPFRRPIGQVTFVVHGIHLRKYDFLSKTLANRIKRYLRLKLERYLYHRCNQIVALTKTDKQDVLRLYGEDLKVAIKPNTLEGWEPKLAKELPSQISGEYKYLIIGRFNFQKGQDRWIKRVKSDGRTLFIGDGETLADCKALAQKLGVMEQCAFVGAIPNAEQYLRCAEIIVSPSRWEGMPYLMMKARALGCKILATDCPGNRDVLAGYENWQKLEL